VLIFCLILHRVAMTHVGAMNEHKPIVSPPHFHEETARKIQVISRQQHTLYLVQVNERFESPGVRDCCLL